MIEFGGLEHVRKVFIAGLQQAFGSNVVPQFLWTDDPVTSKIQILQAYPQQIQKLPFIVVSLSRSSQDISFVGNEEAWRIEDEKLIIGGKMEVTVELKIGSFSLTDTTQLTDFVVLFLRHLFRPVFLKFGISYTRITIEGEGTEDYEGQLMFTNKITVPCYSEYSGTVPSDLIQAITVTPFVRMEL